MRIDIMTLFPDTVNAVLHESIIGRAAKKGIVEINCVQIRDFTENKQNQVDDYPYGGGFGCVMMAQPLKSCLDHIMSTAGKQRSRVIYMSPQGQPYTQETAKRLKRDYDHLVLVCGHYEGVDERFIEQCVDEEISLGDFVLTGGEIAAMAVADSVCRLVPGVLADEQCYTGESHWDGLLEYPQYTRPEVWEGRAVPEVLINGDHARVEKWRRKKQLERTRDKRPDMFAKLDLQDKQDMELLKELARDAKRKKLTAPLEFRPATEADIPDIMRIVNDARRSLKKHRVDQWQGEYPTEESFMADIARGECRVVTHDGEVAAFFTLSTREEPGYAAITDGKWSADMPYCVLHRAAVAADYRGTGVSGYIMKCVEQLAVGYGLRCVRVDTHRKNKPMQQLLRENGYRYRGNIQVNSEPGHDSARQAFEKILKTKK
ncbi:MAG: tRNA (guanosine(37)-N1)-methyltransferase TrmD [Oscillospiraceae bacterium]|nr:tRNA (guanosine(37)-N1)-methyltransferase TrmD [Oscillospiraceae bacterium]